MALLFYTLYWSLCYFIVGLFVYWHLFLNRNEQYQEELWSISCDLLKEWMSPDIRDKYGPLKQGNNNMQHDKDH